MRTCIQAIINKFKRFHICIFIYIYIAIIIKEKNKTAIEILHEAGRIVWRQKKGDSVLEEQDTAI